MIDHVKIRQLKKIIVCGDRNYTNKGRIRGVLERYGPNVTIIEGGAKGADALAGEVADELGLTHQTIPANWEHWGRKAGPIRNRAMLDEKPDLVIAFHDNIDESKGTKNMIDQADKAGVEWDLYGEDGLVDWEDEDEGP